jgi:hypothetical protein
MTPTKRAEFPLFILAGLVLAAVVVLLMTGHSVPSPLYAIGLAAAAGGLGLANPSTSSASSTTGFKMPSEAELDDLVQSIGKMVPKLLHELEDVFDHPVATAGLTLVPPVASHASVTTVRPTEPPTAS